MKDLPQSMPSTVTVRTTSSKRRAVSVPPLLESMLDAIPALVALARSDGVLVYINAPLLHACGWSGETRRSRRLNQLLPADDAARMLATAAVTTARAPLLTPGGSTLTIEWTARTVTSEVGDSFRCIIGRDLTRETELEGFIVENQWFETAAALSGGLAHDFNNVLAAILGLAEIIALRLPPGHSLHEFAGKIGGTIERAKELVRRFSQFSRKSAGGSEPQPTTMVLDELAKLVRGFVPGSVTFSLDLAADTPWCEADRYVLEQIILNCVNFLRARLRSDNGSIKLSCRASPDRSRVLIDLHGSGQGLLGVDVESCFAIDLRPTATAYESGIGLHVARVLAERQNGRLDVVRHDPRSVSFVLDLPVAR